ncbi:Uncharacterised protein [Kurthia zopfii]|nr:Uncharacterised protein [Kurthia zopfii]
MGEFYRTDVKADIENASTLVTALKDSQVKTELKEKITSASTQLEEALQSLNLEMRLLLPLLESCFAHVNQFHSLLI